MRASRLCALCVLVVATAAPASAQIVIDGPYFFGGTTRYYLISNGNYEELRAKARSMGGDLATINNGLENVFLGNALSASKPYIGLNDAQVEGTFEWADGSSSAFRKWGPGEPNNTESRDYTRMFNTAGDWELVGPSDSNAALVEIPMSRPMHVPAELPTLERAINAANTIGVRRLIIAPGVYDLNTPVNAASQHISGAGMGVTTVRLPATGQGLATEFSTVILEDMSIVKRSSSWGIKAVAPLTRFRRVEFTSTNTSDVFVYLPTPSSAVNFEGCVLSGVTAVQSMGASVVASSTIFRDMPSVVLSTDPAASFFATNCTFARIPAGALVGQANEQSITNSIFLDVSGLQALSLSYSLSPTALPGTGNKVGDPRFTNAAANDFSLLADSPAIDAGYLTNYMTAQPQDFLDFARNLRAVDAPSIADALPGYTPIDLGAIEFQPPICKPDFNGDGFVDDFDFVLFAQAYDLFTCP